MNSERIGFKEILGPLAQKIEKKILSGSYTAMCILIEDIHYRNDIQAEQMGDELLSTIMAMIHHSIDPYLELLLPDTVTNLLNEFSQILAGRLENSLNRLKYSQQGVLELDKVIRGICSELINAGGSEIRTNFGKVNRLVAILSCDDV